MNIGLVDVDSHSKFPNLALMKLSTYHKALGDEVEWANSLLHYDRIYMAKVFDSTYTEDDLTSYQCEELIKGGTGYDLTSRLPYEVEHQYPDYDLYGITNMAYGYLTRGCPRHCPFCIVGDKEGLVCHKVADLSEFWRGQKEIKLLDPNITASKEYFDLMDQLRDSRAWIDFTQGLDIRLMTKEKAKALKGIKCKIIHFAWDNPTDMFSYEQLKKYVDDIPFDERRKRVYVLTNFNSTHEQDLMRCEKLKEIGYDPYVMIFDKPSAPKLTKKLARYINNKFIYRSCKSFEEYLASQKQ